MIKIDKFHIFSNGRYSDMVIQTTKHLTNILKCTMYNWLCRTLLSKTPIPRYSILSAINGDNLFLIRKIDHLCCSLSKVFWKKIYHYGRSSVFNADYLENIGASVIYQLLLNVFKQLIKVDVKKSYCFG